MTLGAAPVAVWTSISASLLFWTGVTLLPIALFMGIMSRLSPVPSWAVFLIVLGNAGWALASVMLPVLDLISPNALGWFFLMAQAAVVAFFTFMETRFAGWRTGVEATQ